MRSLREKSGLTQDDVAAELHITRQTISSWENGRTQPNYVFLQAYANALSVELAALFVDNTEKST